MKKILALILCVVMSASIFSACGKKEIDLPIAELNEDITEPMGKFYITNKKPAAEGGLVSLGKDFAVLMIEGKEYTFNLSAKEISSCYSEKRTARLSESAACTAKSAPQR